MTINVYRQRLNELESFYDRMAARMVLAGCGAITVAWAWFLVKVLL